MVRLVSVALFVAVVEGPGWSQSIGAMPKPLSPEAWRLGETAAGQSPFRMSLDTTIWDDANTNLFAGSEVSPNSTLGLGVFGLKRDRMALPPVTVYEVNTRQSRRPGVGLSLKF
jgi:hypothetical protein